jgi:hypothetical protein
VPRQSRAEAVPAACVEGCTARRAATIALLFNGLVSTLRRSNTNARSQGYALRPTYANPLSQVSTEELLLELRRRIIDPATDATTLGTTGTASTPEATGPSKANITEDIWRRGRSR